MGAFAKFLDARRQSHRSADNSFEHVSSPVARIIERVATAKIRRAIAEGDLDSAERYRQLLRDHVERSGAT